MEFTVKAMVEVSVEMTIRAKSEDEARRIFSGHIAMTASLPDIDEDKYDVLDDAIWEMRDLEIDEA